MMLETWSTVLLASFQELGIGIANFVPKVLFAVLIFIAGWVVGSVLGRVVAQVIKSLRVDQGLRAAGVEDVVHRAGYHLDSGMFLGGLVKWFVIVVFLVASFDILGLNQVNQFLQQVVIFYLPNVIVAVLILLVASVVAETVRNVIAAAASAAEVHSAHFLGVAAKWAIWITAIIAALYQLGVATRLLDILSTSIAVAVSLALGLSFGLGGQDAAKKYIEKLREEMGARR